MQPDRVPVARLRPAEPARPLRDQHRPPAPVPQISDRAARAIWSSDYEVEVSVGRSASEIPYPYVLDGTDDLRLDGAQRRRPRRAGSRPPSSPISATRSPTATGTTAAGRRAAAVAVRRAARRFQPGAAAPLYRHAGPSTPSATCCSPTMSAMSTSSSAGRSRSCARDGQPLSRRCPRRAASSSPRTRPTPVAQVARGRLAPAPDAGLSSDRARTARASPWSISASARPTPRRSATISR